MTEVFVAIDGDDVGNRLESLILEGNEAGLRAYSSQVATALEVLSQFFRDGGATVLVQGGDTLLVKAADMTPERVAELLHDCLIPVSAGVGCTLPAAYLALRYAKCAGKGRVVHLPADAVPAELLRDLREIRVRS